MTRLKSFDALAQAPEIKAQKLGDQFFDKIYTKSRLVERRGVSPKYRGKRPTVQPAPWNHPTKVEIQTMARTMIPDPRVRDLLKQTPGYQTALALAI